MVNMLRCACRIAAFAIFAGQYSCIDKQYDLSDLDTDDVTIGNELTLPLGTGIIAAGDIVHIEDNEEITVDDAGNYVARYSGEIGVDMPGEIGIGESCISESRLDIPLAPAGSPYDYPEDAEIELGESSVGLDLATSNIVRLDSVLFDNRNGASRLELKLSVENLRLDDGDAEVAFRASFPKGYRMASETGQDGNFADSEYSCTIPMRELNGRPKSVRLLLQKAVVGTDDRIVYSASLRIKKNASLSVSGIPGLRIAGGISSPDYQVIYGLIDDKITTEPVDIETEGLDDLFDGEDGVLSFADPHIRLTTYTNVGIPLQASLAMRSVNSRSGATESVAADRIAVNAPRRHTGRTAPATSGSALRTATFPRHTRSRHVRSTTCSGFPRTISRSIQRYARTPARPTRGPASIRKTLSPGSPTRSRSRSLPPPTFTGGPTRRSTKRSTRI